MKRSTRILTVVAALLGIVLLLLIVLPLIFRDRIAERVKLEANRSVNARVDWRDVGLSFFRHFPNLTLRLDGLTVAGLGKFQGDTLAAIDHLGLALSLPSVLSNVIGGGEKPIVVRSIELEHPRLSLIKLPDGTANWDIGKKTAQAQEPAAKPMAVSLRRFTIRDGAIVFDNRQARLKASLAGYDQSLSGDFSQQRAVVRTEAEADTVSLSFAGVPYLTRVKLGLTADADADLANKRYSLRGTELRLNDLKLGVSGWVRSIGDRLGLDLGFNAPSTNFRSILSLVPVVYAHDFDKVKTSGSFSVNGTVKGEYGRSAFPGFGVNAKVVNAAFQYPDLPLPARDISMDLSLTNPGGSADSTLVRLDRFHLRLGANPVDASMTLRTPVSDPEVDARVAGKVDLADVRRTVKLEGISELSGTIAADATVRARMSALQKKQYDRVAARGRVDVGNFTVKGKTLPRPMAIRQASLTLAPERARLESFAGTVGTSDIEASGSLDNLLSFAFRDDTLRGTATVHSNRFNLDEWRSGEGDLQVIQVPPKIDFGLTATVTELTYDKLKMSNARGKLRVKDQRVTLEDFRTNTLGGEIALNGFYETTDPAKPAFDVGFRMTRVDIPSAFQAFTTIQTLAPVAKYARGKVNTDLQLSGALGKNMLPLFAGLSGKGTLQTANVALHDFPAMNKIVDVTKLQILNNPTMENIRTAFQIHDGRLFVDPFAVKLGPTTLNVSGSNGLDQSLDYALKLGVPRSLLGGGAGQAIAGLVSNAGRAGVNLAAAPEVPLGIQLGGTVTDPVVKVDVGSLATSVKTGAEQAVKQAVTQKVDSAALRLVREAEGRAAAIRQQGESLAADVKRVGYQQADSLTAKAGSNPLLQVGAKRAAEQLRKETDAKAAGIVGEANRRADSLVAAARRGAGQP